MRLIDADALGIGRCNPDVFPVVNRGYCAGWNGVINLIEDAPTIDPASLRPKGEWISVEDRLPDIVSVEKAGRNTYRKSCRVLCACLQANGKQMVKEGYFYFFNDYPSPCWKIPGTIHSVTHWMPLPEPPDMRKEVAPDVMMQPTEEADDG